MSLNKNNKIVRFIKRICLSKVVNLNMMTRKNKYQSEKKNLIRKQFGDFSTFEDFLSLLKSQYDLCTELHERYVRNHSKPTAGRAYQESKGVLKALYQEFGEFMFNPTYHTEAVNSRMDLLKNMLNGTLIDRERSVPSNLDLDEIELLLRSLGRRGE